MGYLFLAVVFYTVVKFGTEVWQQLRDEAEREICNSFNLRTAKKYHENEMELQRLRNNP